MVTPPPAAAAGFCCGVRTKYRDKAFLMLQKAVPGMPISYYRKSYHRNVLCKFWKSSEGTAGRGSSLEKGRQRWGSVRQGVKCTEVITSLLPPRAQIR